MSARYVCIHGHFYQPPRENPWLEMVELQDTAFPYHDWNERITAECYAPNTVARILGPGGRVARLVNNYARMSFNFGPTLLAWLQEKEPGLYHRLLEADRESCERFSGHGSAIAQVFGVQWPWMTSSGKSIRSAFSATARSHQPSMARRMRSGSPRKPFMLTAATRVLFMPISTC